VSARSVAVYGAAGYTGQRVAAELHRRGLRIVLSGRDARALDGVARALGDADVRPARVEQPHELATALAGCSAVVNCAGPFATTGEPVVRAALESGCHYLDTTAEQGYMKRLFDVYDGPAKDARVAIVPAVGFFYVLGDLLAHIVSEGVGSIDDVTVAYGVRGWRLTRGSRLTVLKVSGGRTVFVGGAQRPGARRLRASNFDFGPGLGRRRVFEFPTGEVLTLPRHVATRGVTTLLAMDAFPGRLTRFLPRLATSWLAPFFVAMGPLIDPILGLFPDRVSAAERARSTFDVVVRVRAGGRERTGKVSGSDIYGQSAITAAEAAERMIAPGFAARGALGAAEAFPPRPFLAALRPHGVTCEVGA
jgi:short subunit dehydrogenase-like uncharacterized protein